MTVDLEYKGNKYGNREDANKYCVRVIRIPQSEQVQLIVEFTEPARGRGVGPSVGAVNALHLRVPEEVAKIIGHLFLAAGELAFAGPLEVLISEQNPMSVSKPAA